MHIVNVLGKIYTKYNKYLLDLKNLKNNILLDFNADRWRMDPQIVESNLLKNRIIILLLLAKL